jgi:hypothetical protein
LISHAGGHSAEWGKKFYTTGAIVNKPVFLAVNVEAGKSSYVMLSSQVQEHSDGVTREIRYGWRLSELSTAEGAVSLIKRAINPPCRRRRRLPTE